jgi:stage III sporulation protein AB
MLPVKWIGALFILLAAATLGNRQAARQRRRVSELEEFRLALRLLSAEVGYTATPLPRALKEVVPRLGQEEVRNFFREAVGRLAEGGENAGGAWTYATEKSRRSLALEGADLAAVLRAAAGLGGLGRVEQVKQLEAAEAELAKLAAEAAEGLAGREKMWRYLGVLGGITVVILLL